MKFSTPKTEKAAAAEFLPGLFNSALGLEGQPILRLEERVTQLYDELSLPVYRYLLCLGMGPSEASDVIQETFLRLYRHLHAGRREDKLRGWVFRVAHNLALNFLKSHKHLDLDESAVVNRSAPDPDPEELLLHQEKMARLHGAISSLSAQQRRCVYLRAEGFRYREIAEILDVSVSTVAESVRRAIKKLTKESDG